MESRRYANLLLGSVKSGLLCTACLNCPQNWVHSIRLPLKVGKAILSSCTVLHLVGVEMVGVVYIGGMRWRHFLQC